MLRSIIVGAGLFALASLSHADEAGRVVFSTGAVSVHGQSVAIGSPVQEGEELVTGNDGYIYIKTVDDGFLILRPNSRARIVAYHIDEKTPANTRFKIELTSGVAREISGNAVKQARENYRFNTPVAAIGVRGTDFTVFTDGEVTRVAVISGGIVVSGFGGACNAAGIGPCEGGNARELSAVQTGQLLQVKKGEVIPQLLKNNNLLPDFISPPRSDEPVAKAQSTVDPSLDAQKAASLPQLETVVVPPPPPVVVPPPVTTTPPPVTDVSHPILWGRYQALLGQSATLNPALVVNPSFEVVAETAYFAILRPQGSAWQVPVQGSMGFALNGGEAYIVNNTTNAMTPTTMTNGQLNVNFANASFTTGFDLAYGSSEVNLHNQGTVSANGLLQGGLLYTNGNNMAVNGALSSDNGGSAAYIFQGVINNQNSATGITYWQKK